MQASSPLFNFLILTINSLFISLHYLKKNEFKIKLETRQ